MGWEQRGSNSYYYKKEREGSKVKSVYVGSGDVAHMISKLQSSSRMVERLGRLMKSPQALEQERVEAELDQLTDRIHLITHGALLAAGFHTHKRQWRKKDMGEQIDVNAVGMDRYEKLNALVKNTHKEKPKPEDLAELRRFFDEDPELWRTTGNMAKRTLDHLLRTYYSQSLYLRECVSRRVKEMREQLGYAESPPLEKILIEHVLVCWVNLYVLEMNSATKLCESHSTETGLYWDKRLTGAQRRFRRASESLARVHKLSRNTRALQFNIAASGGQQVNLTK